MRFYRTILSLFVVLGVVLAEEGMYPISEIHELDLQKKGLLIKTDEVYNPKGISLIDAIVKVGGCSGSFVSSQGLIITNHHCAQGSVQAASTPQQNYLRDGFYASTLEQEIQAKGMTARITESYRDVSEQVLRAVRKNMDLAQRSKAIERRIKEIIAQVEKDNPGKRAEVSEMFRGKTYVLFLYTFLRDIRLVYVPPLGIGNFGGDEDNWIWPRHTGDFSFMRAYVAPDGTPADYSAENVPYQPKIFLQIAPEGASEKDFVFILGYPGRTFRHETSHYLSYERQVRMPYVVDWYQWQIDLMTKMGQDDSAVALKHASVIYGLSNTVKNYRGKLQGIERLQLLAQRRADEAALQNHIESNPTRKTVYGDVLSRIETYYTNLASVAEGEFILGYLVSSCRMLSLAYTLYESAIELQRKDLDREQAYMERNLVMTKKRLQLALQNYVPETDQQILQELLIRAVRLPEERQIPAVRQLFGVDATQQEVADFVKTAYEKSTLHHEEVYFRYFGKPSAEVEQVSDPLLKMAMALYPTLQGLKDTQKARSAELDILSAKLLDVKQSFLSKKFIPDANGTLRLTFGSVRGYKPSDAVSYHPLSSTRGILEKQTGIEPFNAPSDLLELVKSRDFGRYARSDISGVPVCLLYDLDTTGGNSGSPVLDAKGRLVGVNFDRAYEATINDYAWSTDFSRSIAVDIRFVLWVLEKWSNAATLLHELNVM